MLSRIIIIIIINTSDSVFFFFTFRTYHTAQPKHGTRLREHERQGDAATDFRGTQTGHGRRHNVLQEVFGKASAGKYSRESPEIDFIKYSRELMEIDFEKKYTSVYIQSSVIQANRHSDQFPKNR